MTISQPRSIFLGLSLLLAACGGEGLTLPPDGAAAHIVVLSGDDQSARVGEPLPDSVVVKVTDTQNRSVAGAEVVFEFTANGSVANPDTVSTNADGIAWSHLVLGTVPGRVTGTVKVPVDAGVTPVEAAITATATPSDANGIALVSGDAQTGPVGTQLPAPLVVAVTDQFGNPISGISVQWSVTGGGSVSSDASVTDVNGQASVTRTLGPAAGAQTAVATAAGLAGSPVPFNHTATAGNAARVIVVDGNGQSAPAGTKLPKQLAIRVLDAENNPISGQPVSWVVGIGEGSASPENSTTDGNGEARTEWTLGPNPGPNTLTAVADVGRASFNATGDRLASTTRITSHTEPSIVGTPVNVGVTVDGAGGPPSGQVTVSGDGAAASCTITLANGSGSCSITFTQPGNRDLTATYAGDARFSGSSVTVKHQVIPAPNAAPVAQNDTYTATEDQPLVVNAAQGVLNNDSDPEGGPLTAVTPSDPARGTVQLNSDGSFTYAPDENLAGPDQFTYSARDAAGSTTSATVTINVAPVNDPPTGATFVPPNCSVGLPCSFEAFVDDPDQGDVLTYDWDFGDGSPHGSGATVSHTYLVAVEVTVTLTVTDSAGASDSQSDTFTVNP